MDELDSNNLGPTDQGNLTGLLFFSYQTTFSINYLYGNSPEFQEAFIAFRSILQEKEKRHMFSNIPGVQQLITVTIKYALMCVDKAMIRSYLRFNTCSFMFTAREIYDLRSSTMSRPSQTPRSSWRCVWTVRRHKGSSIWCHTEIKGNFGSLMAKSRACLQINVYQSAC